MRIGAHGSRVVIANIGGLTHIEPTKVDRDFDKAVETLAGLTDIDRVITNSPFEGNRGACTGNAGTCGRERVDQAPAASMEFRILELLRRIRAFS